MVAGKKTKRIEKKPITEERQIQVVPPSEGNTQVLTVQFLAAIDKTLKEILEQLKNG